MADWLGRELAGYWIDERIGEGGVTAVYRAHALATEQPVVFKVIHPRLQISETHFMAWAHAAAAVQHPQVAPILSYGWYNHTGYWVRPQYPGFPLSTLLTRLAASAEFLAVADALQLVQQIAETLRPLHENNIFHGAIHPGNLWFTPQFSNNGHSWRIILMDHLVWSLVPQQPQLFPHLWPYLAPEQGKGEKPSVHSDLYNLAGVLFHLLAKRPPFTIRSFEEAHYFHNEVTPSLAGAWYHRLPARVQALLRKGLEKPPARRLSSAGHWAKAVQDIQEKDELADGETLSALWQGVPSQPAAATPITAQLMISRDDKVSQVVMLDKPVMTLGRSRHNDVFIPAQDVSRHHLQLQWLTNGWHLVDLDSTNGVKIRERRLRPREPHFWQADEPAQVGGYTLRWHPVDLGSRPLPETHLPPPPAQEGELSSAEMFENVFAFAFTEQAPQRGNERVAQDDATHDEDEGIVTVAAATPTPSPMWEPAPMAPQPIVAEPMTPEPLILPPLIEPMTPVAPLPVPLVRLTLTPHEVEIVPGREAFIQVLIANQGQQSERFYLRVEGLPPEWVTVPENRLTLAPGQQDILQINVLNTLSKGTEPGQRTFIVRVSPESAPDIVSVITGYVHIKESISFMAELEPARVRPATPFKVKVHNTGNMEATFSVMGRMAEGEEQAQFLGQTGRLTLKPGQVGELPLTLQAGSRPLIGKPRIIPFRVQVRASHGDSQVLLGELDMTPLLPLWIWAMGGLGCLLATFLLLLLPSLLT